MNNDYTANPSQSNKDTLIFLITEYFLNSPLTAIEASSIQQDNDISNQMDLLYNQSRHIESIKAQLYNDIDQFNSRLNFSTSTYCQFNTHLNISIGKENYYKRLFNKKPLQLQNQKKMLLKPNCINTGQSLCLTESNNNTSSNAKSPLAICNKGIQYNRKMNNYTMSYSRYNTNHNSNSKTKEERQSFQFKPKKQICITTINTSSISRLNQTSNHCFTPRNNNQHMTLNSNSKMNQYRPKTLSNSKINHLLSNEKNEKILQIIMTFLPMKNNNLKGINWLLRRIFLNMLLAQTKKKLNRINKSNHDAIQVSPLCATNLDDKMEIEILKHIEAKVSEFISTIPNKDKDID